MLTKIEAAAQRLRTCTLKDKLDGYGGWRIGYIEDLAILADAYLAETKTEPASLEIAQKAFRELRESWFRKVLERHSHEREWETEEQEERRNASNNAAWMKYDDQTNRILKGENLCLDPRCEADLSEGVSAE